MPGPEAGAAPPAAPAPSGNLGRLSFGFLAVCVLSGVALVPFFRASDPLGSVEEIQAALPWGFFLRALHAVSAWALLVTSVGHLAQVVAKRTEVRLSPGAWWRSVLFLPAGVLALLGGFVLRGDAEGRAAGAVWLRVLESVPAVGGELARFLLGAIPGDAGALLLHHAGTFTLLLWLLTAEHGGRPWPDARSAVLAALASTALAGTLPVPLGPPPQGASGAGLLLGPWYLLGLQGALVDLPAAAGWLAPGILVLALGLLRHAGERGRRLLVGLLLASGAAYAAFTLRILLLSPR